MAITDLTGTTWYVPSGWTATAGYGTFNISGSLVSDEAGSDADFSVLYIGFYNEAGDVFSYDNVVQFGGYTLQNRSLGFTVTFTNGDTSNSSLIQWLTDNNAVQLKVADLTNTTWTVNAGWEAEAGYGEFNVTGRLISQTWDFTAISIGEDDGDYIDNYLCFTPYMAIGNGEVANMSITGGTDVKTPKLIAWLSKWGELQVEEEPENPEEESVTHAVEVYYEGNNIAFLDAGETIAIHMKDKSSPFKLTEDLIIKANILENSSGGGASFGNGYTVTFMSQGAAWAVSGITPGQAVQRPTSPTKDGAYFNGWYTGEDGSGEKISFPYTPTADATLYAKFSQATVVGVTGVMNEEGSLTLTDDIAGMEGYEEAQNGDYVSVTSKLSEAFPFCEIEEFTDDEGNTFVKFPKLWMKWETDASDQITGYKFANYQADSDFFIPDAFLDPNYVTTDTYLDYFALGKYEMSGSTSKGYSKSGATCLVNVTRANARAAARAYGNSSNLYNGYQMLDFAQMTLYNLLCMMFFQTTNIQKVYGGRTGSGTVTSWSAASVTGTTDGVDGLNGWNVTTDCVKLLGVENPYGNVFKWVDGAYFSKGVIYAHRFPQQFNDGTTNGTALGFERPTSSGYITALKKGTANKTRSYVYAAAIGGDAGQYCGDYTYYSSAGTVLYAGGRWSNGGHAGLWYLDGDYDASDSRSYIGARLSYRPL